MYTSKSQSEFLLEQGILENSADMVCFAGKSKTDPYKNWNPVPITGEARKKMATADYIPVWSETALFNLLPLRISGNDLHIMKKVIPGRGVMTCVGYFNPETAMLVHGFLNTSLIDALVGAVKAFICGEHNFAEYDYGG